MGSFLEDEIEDEDEQSEAETVEAEVIDEDDEGVTDNNSRPVAPPQTSDNSLITPATDDLEEIKEVYDQFEQIKSKLLTKDDRESISGRMFIKKSGWRKIATAFNISVETVEEERVVDDGVVKFKVKAVATAPNGKTASGVGMCASNESNHMDYLGDDPDEVENSGPYSVKDDNVLKIDGKWRRLKDPREVNEHNIYATAATRAKNRAISDLVGGGEVSAEEMDADDFF